MSNQVFVQQSVFGVLQIIMNAISLELLVDNKRSATRTQVDHSYRCTKKGVAAKALWCKNAPTKTHLCKKHLQKTHLCKNAPSKNAHTQFFPLFLLLVLVLFLVHLQLQLASYVYLYIYSKKEESKEKVMFFSLFWSRHSHRGGCPT